MSNNTDNKDNIIQRLLPQWSIIKELILSTPTVISQHVEFLRQIKIVDNNLDFFSKNSFKISDRNDMLLQELTTLLEGQQNDSMDYETADELNTRMNNDAKKELMTMIDSYLSENPDSTLSYTLLKDSGKHLSISDIDHKNDGKLLNIILISTIGDIIFIFGVALICKSRFEINVDMEMIRSVKTGFIEDLNDMENIKLIAEKTKEVIDKLNSWKGMLDVKVSKICKSSSLKDYCEKEFTQTEPLLIMSKDETNDVKIQINLLTALNIAMREIADTSKSYIMLRQRNTTPNDDTKTVTTSSGKTKIIDEINFKTINKHLEILCAIAETFELTIKEEICIAKSLDTIKSVNQSIVSTIRDFEKVMDIFKRCKSKLNKRTLIRFHQHCEGFIEESEIISKKKTDILANLKKLKKILDKEIE